MQASLSPGTYFSVRGQVATCKAISLSSSSEAAAASTSTAASWMASAPLLILYITAASVVNVQALPDPSLHVQLDRAVI